MSIEPSRIESIVAEVLDRLDRGDGSGAGARPLGVHRTLEEAVAGARSAFAAYRETKVEVRARVVAAVRQTMLANLETLPKPAGG